MSKSAFILRLPENERLRGKQLANQVGVSENRLYTDIIHDGLLMQEQMLYMSTLRQIASGVSREAALAIFDRVPDIAPSPEDALNAQAD